MDDGGGGGEGRIMKQRCNSDNLKREGCTRSRRHEMHVPDQLIRVIQFAKSDTANVST
jgi:hypothetical protein